MEENGFILQGEPGVTLNEWAGNKKRELQESLIRGQAPNEGTYEEATFRAAIVKGPPQIGSTTFEPNLVHFEFVFSTHNEAATVLRVSIIPPQRIVFMPVPEWVIENIWQGEVLGSYHFESDAEHLIEQLRSEVLHSDQQGERFTGLRKREN